MVRRENGLVYIPICMCVCVLCVVCFFFFFQAEDGIRDHCVTGVQTCALPIFKKDTTGISLRSPINVGESTSSVSIMCQVIGLSRDRKSVV